MKTTHYISFLLSLLLGVGTLAAQNSNRLYIPELTALPGSTLSIPVYVENTTEIVAVQFTLQIPEGSALTTASAALTNRGADHTVTLRTTAPQEYLCVIYSSTNSPLKGRTGKIMTVDMSVPSSYTEGSVHQFMLKDVVLSLRDGSNVLSSAEAGTLTIIRRPDLYVKNVQTDKTEYAPGETMSVGWQVQNIGGKETGDGWSEQVSLIQTDGTSILLGTTYYDETLSASGSVSRQVTFNLPQLLGIDGQANVQVQVIPRPNTGENEGARGNNITTTVTALNISKQLTLTVPTGSIAETNSQPIRCTLARSGNRTQEQTFTLTATADSRLTVPQIVIIPAGQSSVYFNIQITDNSALDDNSEITITASGNGYEAVSGQFSIEDNEFPDLTITASKSLITEGETFQLTITRSRVYATDVEVTLACEKPGRFDFPAKATIPAGAASVTVDVTAKDDDLPGLELSNAFMASTSGYNKGEVIVILQDNDMPALELTLTPNQVSESVGPLAVAATLRRIGVTSNRIVVKLSDDSNGGIYYGSTSIEMAKGVEEVHFNLGPVDNANVDGDRTVNITAAVYISSCSCNASGESVGVVSVPLTILDNDGAALTLSASTSTVKEGDKVTLTISRNTDTTEPLTVSLSSDYSEGLTYPSSVTIPAGQTSTTVEVSTSGNDVQDDSHNVIFTVEANGFAKGICFITITDQTKPDAVITDIHVDNYEIEVGQQVALTVVVANNGIAALPARTEVRISCSSSSERKTLYTPADLPAGESVVLSSDYTLPVTGTGSYTLTATVNPDRKVDELNFNNNSMPSAAITLRPNFTATVTVDKQVYRQGEAVTITGQTSAGGRNANVELYLINNGSRQKQTLKADEEGRFQTTYTPYDRQSGHFVAGACYPGTGESSGSAEFDVYGIILSGVYGSHDISLGDEATGSFVIKNPGMLPQTGLQIEQLNEPNGCELTIGQVSSIDAGGQVQVNYTLKSNAVSPGSDWLQVPLHITTAEGSTADYTIYYYVRSLKGQLKANQTQIETTITKGVPREYQLQISNVGRGETGTISLSLPSWIKSLTPMQMPSLASGDSATIVLQLSTTADMQMNVPVRGQIGINCEKGNGVPISIYMTPVSEDKGSLLLDVVDEYTYYAEGSPHVEGARVLVKHPTTGQVIAQGLTGADGRYLVELPEGWYTVSINADKHLGYQTTLEVAPGRQTSKEIFLSYDAVSYSWNVVETEIEDEYIIETVVKYETNVPKPIIIISLPDEKPEIGGIIPVVVTNKGLINAINADLTLSVNEGLTIEWLSDPTVAVLAPQQSVTFYAVLKEADEPSARRKVPNVIQTLKCLKLKGDLELYYLCGEIENAMELEAKKEWGDCLAGGSGGSSSGGGGIGGGGSTGGTHPGYTPGGGGSSTYGGSSSSGTIPRINNLCHEKDIEGLSLPPVYNGTPLVFGRQDEVNWSAIIYDPDGFVYEVYQSPVDNNTPVTEPDITGYEIFDSENDHRMARGVAADGAAKVDIRLKGKIPFVIADFSWVEDGEEPWEGFKSYDKWFEWSLKEGIGELENTGHCRWVTYKAPEDFPGGPNESEVTVHVVFNYCNSDGEIQEPVEIPIVIARVPLVLLHGLMGDEGTWSSFKKNITPPNE